MHRSNICCIVASSLHSSKPFRSCSVMIVAHESLQADDPLRPWAMLSFVSQNPKPSQSRFSTIYCCLLCKKEENLQFDWSHIQNPQLTFAVWNEQESQPGSHPVRAAPSLQPRCLFQNSRQLARRWQKRYIHSPKAPSPASDRSQKARAARRGRRYFLGVKFRLRLVLVKSPQTLKSPSKKKEPPSDGVCKLAKSQGTIRWNKFSVPSDGFHHAVDKHLCRYLGHPYTFAAREACIDLVHSTIVDFTPTRVQPK